MTRRVLIAELSGVLVRGRPRLDGLCVIDLAQQKHDSGGCRIMLER